MPQQAAINFVPQIDQSSDQLGGAMPLAFNVSVDARGCVLKRPGIAQFGQLDEPLFNGAVNGLHVDANGNVWAANSGSAGANIYRVTPAGSVLSAGFVLGTSRVSFAETEAMIVAVAGDKPYRSSLVVPFIEELPGTPPRSTRVSAQAGRLVLMGTGGDSNIAHFSGYAAGSSTAGHEEWNGLGISGYVDTRAKPDLNQSMDDNTNELYIWGRNTLQVFAPDPISDYAPVSTRELGLIAPSGVVKDDQSFWWPDQYRRIVNSDGRSFSDVSAPIKTQLEGLSDIQSGYGFRCLAGVTDALAWTFPTDQRTFVYSKRGSWSEWASWSQSTQNRTKFLVTAAAADSNNGRTVVGLSDGRLGILTHDAQDDLGVQFTAHIETGFEDRGTHNRKLCRSISLTLRRGFARPLINVPSILIQWRDDEGAWSSPLSIDLGALPDREVVVHRHGLGYYRRRQWRFTFLSGDPVALVRAEETFEITGV